MPNAAQCFHCDEPLPPHQPAAYAGDINGQRQLFCCPACRTVAQSIHELGLDQYYRQRDHKPAHAAMPAEDWSDMDIALAEGTLGARMTDGDIEAQLHIADIHCASCCWLIENRLKTLAGISEAEAQLGAQKLRVRWNPQELPASQLFAALAAIGYRARLWHSSDQQQQAQQQQKALLKRTGLAGIVAMQIHMIAMGNYFGEGHDLDPLYQQWMNGCALLLSVPVWLYSAQPFFSSAWRSLRAGFLGMDLPVAIAIIAAAAASIIGVLDNTNDVYFDSIAMFVFLLLGARYLEARARSRLAVDGQAASLPLTCNRLCGQTEERIAVSSLATGDIVVAHAGDIIAADGVVIAGEAAVEQAAITGEFMPVHKRAGDSILAGSRISGGTLQLSARQWGADSHIAQLQTQVDRALAEKSRAHAYERTARLFTPLVLLTAAGSAIFWAIVDPHKALPAALAVLVASCPCALSLAIPAALTATTLTLRKRGVLITGSHVLTLLPKLRHLVFDKTGSLTEGSFRLSRTKTLGVLSESECLAIAAALEQHSRHPVASAFPATPATPEACDVVQTVHKGLEGTIDGRRYRIGTPSWSGIEAADSAQMSIGLSDDSGPLALFHVGDSLRSDAVQCVKTLRNSGITCSILSGDSSQQVDDIAATLGIRTFDKGCSPDEKVAKLQQLRQQNVIVGMLGDGINDGPVLANADISLTLADASQTARLAADVLLLNNRLDDINTLLTAARKTQRVARQNVAWALLYNIAILPMAAAGFLPPAVAALGMALSSLLVTANALRLFRPAPAQRT